MAADCRSLASLGMKINEKSIYPSFSKNKQMVSIPR